MGSMQWRWSDRVEEADWIAERQPVGWPFECTIPQGFDAYARLLHPIQSFDPDADETDPGAPVRWAEVAQWSGSTLGPRTPFWRLALPEHLPDAPIPGGGFPASDVLGRHDGAALAAVLRRYTGTPDDCWFGIWEGYGWRRGLPGAPTHRRVQLPARDYLLITGPVEAGLALLPDERELADLWWPRDRAWFVYGDVDLSSTYVGGSAALVDELLAAPELEALPADPADPTGVDLTALPDWLAEQVGAAVQDLLSSGAAAVATSRFTMWFDFGEPTSFRMPHYAQTAPRTGRGLRHRCDSESRGRGWTALPPNVYLPAWLHREVVRHVIDEVGE